MQLALWILITFGLSLLLVYLTGRRRADAQQHPYTFKCSDKRAEFERWQDHLINQHGAASTTLFALASAGLGCSLSLLSDSSRPLLACNTASIRIFTCTFAVSFLFGFFSIFNRLEDYRNTMRRHKLRDENHNDPAVEMLYRTTRRMGEWTWGLLYAQGIFFIIASIMFIYFWLANYGNKL